MKKHLEYRGYLGSVEVSFEDNRLIGQIQFIKDVIGYDGETIDEITTNFHCAVDDYLAFCQEKGYIPDAPFSGTFNCRVGEELHRRAAFFATKTQATLND